MKHVFLILMTFVIATTAQASPTPLQIKEIDKGVYLHTSFQTVDGYGEVDSNGLVVVNDEGDGGQAIIIDTPWSASDTEKLLVWIKQQGFTVVASLSTHFHEDRTAGIQVLNEQSIPTYTSKLTNDLLVQHGKPTATQIFEGSEFVLKEGLVEVFYPGAGHSEDNLVVWLPKQNLLVGGCLVRGHEWDSLGFTGDANIESWANSIRAVQSKYPAIAVIVPGHGEIGGPDMLDHTIELAERATGQ